MDALARAVELAEENDLHTVCVTLRGEVPDELRAQLLREAALEARAVIDAEGWAVWWAEDDADGALFVLNGLAQDVKEALVNLESGHELGDWFNLDVVTRLDDGQVGVWHASPMRPAARATRGSDDLHSALDGYDWS